MLVISMKLVGISTSTTFGIEPASDIKLVRVEEIPDHDVLFAGFPCQPFSIIGDMKGLDDRRGTLFHEILRVVKAKKPKACGIRECAPIRNHFQRKRAERRFK